MQNCKEILEKYMFWFEENKRIYENETIFEILRTNTDLEFYTLEFIQSSKKNRIKKWLGHIFLTIEEAQAYQAFVSKTKSRNFDKNVDFKVTTRIIKLDVNDVMENDEHLRRLSNRIEKITPYNKSDIENIDENSSLVWFFKSGNYHFITKQNNIKIPENFNYFEGFTPIEIVVNSNNKLGLYHKKKKEFVLPCEYKYINIQSNYAEASKKEINSFDSKENICSIYNLETKEEIEKNAIKYSLGVLYGEFLVLKDDKIAYKNEHGYISKFYDDISDFWNSMASFKENELWGFIDKNGNEVIKANFLDYSYFNFGYSVVRHKDSPNCKMLIDKEGKVLIDSIYIGIEHYKDDLFFVKNEQNEYAVFKKSQQLTEFIKTSDNYSDDLEKQLDLLISDYKKQKYDLPLKQYLDLFPNVDLHELELFNHPVIVKEIPENYKDIVTCEEAKIGWEYPCSKNMFDFKRELPVILKKHDGSNLSLGISFDKLCLDC